MGTSVVQVRVGLDLLRACFLVLCVKSRCVRPLMCFLINSLTLIWHLHCLIRPMSGDSVIHHVVFYCLSCNILQRKCQLACDSVRIDYQRSVHFCQALWLHLTCHEDLSMSEVDGTDGWIWSQLKQLLHNLDFAECFVFDNMKQHLQSI